MSEFKFVCPVCGQHMKCDSSQSGMVMECPTCFQNITAPQAPETDDSKFIITGTKVGERPISAGGADSEVAPMPAPEKKFPVALVIALVILICVGGAAALFMFSGKKSSRPAEVIPMIPAEPKHGAIGLGSWNTQVEYTNVVVTKGTQTLYQSSFGSNATNWQVTGGTWIATNGVFVQTVITTNCRAVTGDAAWSDYTLTLKARKIGGQEGFHIMFNVMDDQNWTRWNLGGWNNTKHGIQNCVSGVKSILDKQVPGQIDTGHWYNIRIELSGQNIRCYLDGEMIHDADYPALIPSRSP